MTDQIFPDADDVKLDASRLGYLERIQSAKTPAELDKLVWNVQNEAYFIGVITGREQERNSYARGILVQELEHLREELTRYKNDDGKDGARVRVRV